MPSTRLKMIELLTTQLKSSGRDCRQQVTIMPFITLQQWRLYRGEGQEAPATPDETLAPGGPPFKLATKYAWLRPVPVGPHIPCLPPHWPPSHQRLEPPLHCRAEIRRLAVLAYSIGLQYRLVILCVALIQYLCRRLCVVSDVNDSML